ncbi:hypothetical protein, partial [Nocardia farcinica]|uniref:hypothetical protein n=1 Tax=Nocardia farcinica TaxID=37329 RepID=UPI001E47293B
MSLIVIAEWCSSRGRASGSPNGPLPRHPSIRRLGASRWWRHARRRSGPRRRPLLIWALGAGVRVPRMLRRLFAAVGTADRV